MTIGGTTAATANIIGSNTSAGVSISGSSASGNLVEGNFIGTNAANVPLNNAIGIVLGSASNTVGGTIAAAANIIAFNSQEGIQITGADATGNVVAGNFIGTDSANDDLGNGIGVQIVNAPGPNSPGNTIGGTVVGAGTASPAGNTIGFNSQDGILVRSGIGNSILENTYIGTNGPSTPTEANDIALGSTVIIVQPAPTIVAASIPSTSSTTLNLRVNVSESAAQFVEIYLVDATSPGQRVFLGEQTVTNEQNMQITVPSGLIAPSTNGSNGSILVATATDSVSGTTSVFSARIQVFDSLTVTTTEDGQDIPWKRLQTDFVGSLRYAIDFADNDAPPPAMNPTDDTFHITFAISTGPFVIGLTSVLPGITVPVTIDGTTESTFLGTPTIVQINGAAITGDGFTLSTGSSGSTITGLDIAAFKSGAGIHIEFGQ